MTDQPAVLDEALEEVIHAARAHLAAVKAADGVIDDEQVWRTYVTLNNAAAEYDERLLDTYGEVTPFDTERIDPREADLAATDGPPAEPANDPYPAVLSIRQRRDFRVPSVTALLAAAADTVGRTSGDTDHELAEPETVVEAVLGLVQAGDGSLSPLDLPVLEPLDGVITVAEVSQPLDLATVGDTDGAELFGFAPDDRVVGRLDEHPYVEYDGDESDAQQG